MRIKYGIDKKMNVLITGGAGYIGYALAEKLAENAAIKEIILFDNLSRHNENIFFAETHGAEKFKLIRADILDARKLNNALKGVDIVYHLAAKVITPFANQDPHFFEQINHWGTSELVDAVEKNNIKKLIYLSSASVYDRISEEANENTFPNPSTYYGISKLRGEEHIQRLNGIAETFILRCGNVYGFSNSMRFDAVINNLMMRANFENKISIHGTGAQTRAFIHIDNAVDALSQIPFSATPPGIYNLVTKNLAVNDIAEVVLQLYPSCDRIFINQHLHLGSIKVNPGSKLWEHISIQEYSLLEELTTFKNRFAFSYK
ncbi:MAG: NAD-dependent epimerase/dehydratase family protein [Chitinophagales bacterium]